MTPVRPLYGEGMSRYRSALSIQKNISLIIPQVSAKIQKRKLEVIRLASHASNEATLSSSGNMTVFTFGKHVIRFRTSPHLVCYTGIKEWDNGYIVCTAKYDTSEELEEEYIDLIPILKNLYFEPSHFLTPIEKVRVNYD